MLFDWGESMGLFGMSKKKKDESSGSVVASQMQKTLGSMPELPEFPTLPEEDGDSEFPTYEPTVADIKKEVSRGTYEEFMVPVREPGLTTKKMVSASVVPDSEMNMPSMPTRASFGGEKPLFVQIDTYKDAIHTLQALKSKLDDAEETLKALEDVKSQENEKLDEWKKDLQNLKEKLLSIDRDLFEV